MARDRIRIPRRVDAKFKIFGLGWKELLMMAPFLGLAGLVVYLLASFLSFCIGILIIGIPYVLLSQSKYGRTGLDDLIAQFNYIMNVQKRYDWRWTDEDIIKQTIRFSFKRKEKKDQQSNDTSGTPDLLN